MQPVVVVETGKQETRTQAGSSRGSNKAAEAGGQARRGRAPCSMMRPPSTTAILSALITVDRRCATRICSRKANTAKQRRAARKHEVRSRKKEITVDARGQRMANSTQADQARFLRQGTTQGRATAWQRNRHEPLSSHHRAAAEPDEVVNRRLHQRLALRVQRRRRLVLSDGPVQTAIASVEGEDTTRTRR